MAVSGLSEPEASYVYNCEVLGLPARKAAQLAGLPVGQILAPHLVQAREIVKQQVRGATTITKEDVVHGMRDAIHRAQILAEPMTEIVGWKEIARLLGYDAPQKIDINIQTSVDVIKARARTLTDAELVKLVGAGAVIDADFYEVPNG